MLEYAHQTYSELLFTFLLVWTIYSILRASENESISFTIVAALLTMVSFYIRVAGLAVAGAAVLFFTWQHRWKQLIVFILTCAILYSPMKIYEWSSGAAAFGQASILLLKNPYNTMQGTETLSGFIERLINNVMNHLNYQIPSALGLPMPPKIAGADGKFLFFPDQYGKESLDWFACFGIIISTVMLIGLISPVVRRQKSMLTFLSLFVIGYIGFISLALQNLFATPRMLVPIVPYLLIGTIEGSRWLGNRWAKVRDMEVLTPRVKTFMLVVIIGLTLIDLISTKEVIDQNVPILKANLAGNELAGFTEDWVNYIRAVPVG